MLPAIERREIVGAHDPDEFYGGIAALEERERRSRVGRAEVGFESGNLHAPATSKFFGRLHAFFERRQFAVGLERITGCHDKPELIKTQSFDCRLSDDGVACVRRIERAAHYADALACEDQRRLNTKRAEISERDFSRQGMPPYTCRVALACITAAGPDRSRALCI